MKLENIEEVRILIAKRETLLDILEKSDKWQDAHFELVEHCGNAPDSISLAGFCELTQAFLESVKREIKYIEEQLKEI